MPAEDGAGGSPGRPEAKDGIEDLERLEGAVVALGSAVVAYSGGADSALVAYMCRRVLGREKSLAVTAVSPSLAPEELEDCRDFAARYDLDWRGVDTDELSRAAYRRNDPDRCYHCKSALMDVLEPLATGRQATVVLGVNLDDLDEHRPGQRAAAERGARFPLVEASMTKAAVRALSRRLSLPSADKPQAACLASRVPYGTEVTVEVLSRVQRAESALRRLGFASLRVRHYGDAARIELPLLELSRAIELRDDLVAGVRQAGYRYVTLDLEGLRSGNLNSAIRN
ncbi:MAG: ATP-dependent sacrificial sulfur transferase LarE [Acidimicrobiales bacterium]